MSNILAALARESLLSERVISMEADGAPAGLPAINADMPQNTTPSSQMMPGSSDAKPMPTGGKTGSADANNVVTGDQEPKKETEPPKDTKRLLLEAGYFGVCALKNTMETIAADKSYIESEYGDAKAKGVTDMVQALEEMKSMLSEMYDAKGGEKQPEQQTAAPVNQAAQTGTPVQTQSVPAVDMKEKPEA